MKNPVRYIANDRDLWPIFIVFGVSAVLTGASSGLVGASNWLIDHDLALLAIPLLLLDGAVIIGGFIWAITIVVRVIRGRSILDEDA